MLYLFFKCNRVGVLQNVGIFFEKNLVKKNLFKIPSCFFSLKIQMRIKCAKESFITFFFVQLTKCTLKTYCKKKCQKKSKFTVIIKFEFTNFFKTSLFPADIFL